MVDHTAPHILDMLVHCSSEIAALNFLQEHNILKKPEKCENCDGNDVIMMEGTHKCRCRNCWKMWSIYKDTFFTNSKLPLHIILLIGYFWVQNMTFSTISALLTDIPEPTLSRWLLYYDQLIAGDMHDTEVKIGGPNIIVEVDESKFGKRKYHRGHKVEGVWVVGGVERTPERKVFAIQVPNRNNDTLTDVIRCFVHPGSIVYTDGWAGYNWKDLLDIGMSHGTCNHSEHFVCPETGIHTNTIECTWSVIKQSIPKRNRTKKGIDYRLLEFLWRRKNHGAQWERFLIALNNSKYMISFEDNE